MTFSSRALYRMQYLVGALMVLTVTLLVWHHVGMTRELEVSARSGHAVFANDDRRDGGASSAVLERRDGKLVLTCDLSPKFQWPFCGYHIDMGKGAQGVDLSTFDTVTFELDHESTGSHVLRASIRNFEPAISTVDNWQSQKVNEIEFTMPAQGSVTIPIKLFRTAAWWTAAQKVPLQHTDTRVDNVTALGLYTGTSQGGKHRIVLKSIKFHGKWISQNDLLMLLVAAWFCCGVVWPAMGWMHFRTQLRISKARLASLTGINRALQLEAKELAGQAYTDPLTGALNRQGLRDLLMKQWKTPSLLAEPSSVMFLDLDHFKLTNDQHGHAVGDEVLRAFAVMVQSKIRASDKLVRWGGEEFLIVCPGTDAANALALAEKLRSSMTLHAWPCGLHITASFGVAALANGEDIGAAIERADVALYKAKAAGRNRVELA